MDSRVDPRHQSRLNNSCIASRSLQPRVLETRMVFNVPLKLRPTKSSLVPDSKSCVGRPEPRKLDSQRFPDSTTDFSERPTTR